LAIAPGLSSLPRQQVDFGLLRAAMLDRARDHAALASWTARESRDYGVMLLELWAYAGEIFAIYDKAIADESYVRTAQLRPSLRRLVELLGYLPQPAIASLVEVAAIADGAKPIVLPVGTAFRSGAFAGQPPQVFELVQPATIHPALNRWPLAPTIATTLDGPIDHLLLDAATSRVGANDIVLVQTGATPSDVFVRKIAKLERELDAAGRRLVRAVLSAPIAIAAPVPVADVKIFRARRAASLKSHVEGDGPSYSTPPSLQAIAFQLNQADDSESFELSNNVAVFLDDYQFVLDGVYREARTRGRAIAQVGDELRWFTIFSRTDAQYRVKPDETFEVNGTELTVPITSPFTRLRASWHLTAPEGLAAPGKPSWKTVAADNFVIHVGLERAASVVGPPRTTLASSDPLIPLDTRAPVGSVAQTARLLLRDSEGTGVALDGAIDFALPELVAATGSTWSPLATPVEAFGNVVTAVRGETVASEVLGDGDAARVHQAFALAKKPLTYVAAPNKPRGYASTLRIWVDGVEWFEVDALYGAAPTAQVFVVRIDDEEVATVTFGDGVYGARLPTGSGNVVARYRFGAGAACPPAGSITQLARPVLGLRGVVGPVVATGGGDRASAATLRALAPQSAMLLGRAISIDDMQVAARAVPGVRAARAEWAWDGVVQRPVVKVWVVGDDKAPESVAKRLRDISDPTTPIRAQAAAAVPVTATFDLELDPLRLADEIIAAVSALLVDELAPAIGAPVIRSRLVAALLGVTGVTGVRGITWNGQPLLAWAIEPGVGHYFDLGSGPTVTGS
jgi:hypothetical protein